jgi:hypothetical protein
MPDINYPQKPYQGQSYGQNFNTGMAQQQAQMTPQQQEAWRRYYEQQRQMYGQIPQQAQMNPQQQMYGQQIQTAAVTPENYRQKINSRSRLAIIAIVTLFVLIFLGALVYFMLPKQQDAMQETPPREEAASTVTATGQVIADDVMIDELTFCTDIDPDFVCTEAETNTFHAGDNVYLYVRIKGFSQVKREEGNLIGIREDIETLDPEGIIVYQLTGTAANIADFISEGQNYLHLRSKISLPLDLGPGAYSFKTIITDKITSKEATLEKGFWIE